MKNLYHTSLCVNKNHIYQIKSAFYNQNLKQQPQKLYKKIYSIKLDKTYLYQLVKNRVNTMKLEQSNTIKLEQSNTLHLKSNTLHLKSNTAQLGKSNTTKRLTTITQADQCNSFKKNYLYKRNEYLYGKNEYLSRKNIINNKVQNIFNKTNIQICNEILDEYFIHLENQLNDSIVNDFGILFFHKFLYDREQKKFDDIIQRFDLIKFQFRQNFIFIKERLRAFLISAEGMRAHQTRKLILKDKYHPDLGEYYENIMKKWNNDINQYNLYCIQFQEQLNNFKKDYTIYTKDIKNKISFLYHKKKSIL